MTERAIQTRVNSDRTMTLRQSLHLPEVFNKCLWPFILSHTAYLWNNLPNGHHGLTTLEIFTGVKQNVLVVRNEKTWGCRLYVLDPKLQDGKKLPKWSHRLRREQYLAKPLLHAISIELIRNLNTRCISHNSM